MMKYKPFLFTMLILYGTGLNTSYANTKERSYDNNYASNINAINIVNNSINHILKTPLKSIKTTYIKRLDNLEQELVPPEELVLAAEDASRRYHIKKEFLLTIARIESGYKQIRSSYQDSSATGPYQFTKAGWKGDIDLCEKSNKLPKETFRLKDRMNYRKSTLILACAMNTVRQNLDQKYENKYDIYTAMYLNHFLGIYDFNRIEDLYELDKKQLVTDSFDTTKIKRNKALLAVYGKKTTIEDVFQTTRGLIKKHLVV